MSASRANRQRGFEHPHCKTKGTEWNNIVCDCCGQAFHMKPSRATKYEYKYCSRKCKDDHQSVIFAGPSNPNWIDGTKDYPEGWNDTLKEMVRDRDGRVCQVCGKTEERNGVKLTVHHINYDKHDLSMINLIAVCIGCHGTMQVNRDYWQTRLTGFMIKRYMTRNISSSTA